MYLPRLDSSRCYLCLHNQPTENVNALEGVSIFMDKEIETQRGTSYLPKIKVGTTSTGQGSVYTQCEALGKSQGLSSLSHL